MNEIEALYNKGVQYIGNHKSLNEERKTLIVVGVARSGTSLVSGSLEHLGVFTGNGSHEPVFEDVKLATAFEESNLEEVKEIIKDYNSKYKVWGFKRPGSLNYLESIDSLCRNPIYLFVFKDIFSIANRNNISVKQDVLIGLQKAHDEYAKILEFITEKSINGFLFSYEKVMGNKEDFVNTLVNIVGKVNVSDEQKESVLAFIEPNPAAYLDATRITESKGFVDTMRRIKVSGWAMSIHSYSPVQVELYVNEQYIMTTDANIMRPGLVEKKIHDNGRAGFVFDLKNNPLQIHDKVNVKVRGDMRFLRSKLTHIV